MIYPDYNQIQNYMQANSGIGNFTNGQIINGTNIFNSGLGLAQLVAGAYLANKQLGLQKQALALNTANQANNQQIQQAKANAAANILAGQGQGVEGYNADANRIAVNNAYAPNTKVA